MIYRSSQHVNREGRQQTKYIRRQKREGRAVEDWGEVRRSTSSDRQSRF
jgi:hypothetical protein